MHFYILYLHTDMTSVCRVKEAFWICTPLVLASNIFLLWMYIKSCSFHKSGCFIISIPINNSTRDTATENPFPYKVTEAAISYNHSISVYLESFNTIDDILELRHNFTNFEETIPSTCQLPSGGRCTMQHSDTNADVVFRVVRAISPSFPVRYWPGQITAVLNMEANRGEYGIYTYGFQQLKEADLRIDHHPTSDAVYSELCYFLPVEEWQRGELQSPDPKERKGIALFSSDCKTQWKGFQNRTWHYEKVVELVHVDSYGKCWNNMPAIPTVKNDDWREVLVNIIKKYRMVLSFENIIQTDYISEKTALIYRGGAIPVYRGPPEVYLWVPGNHTFIDANNYTPEELAEYVKQIDEDDDLFRYHTSNFDVERSRKRVESVCPKANFMCRVCQLAHDMKMNRTIDSGSSNRH